MALATVLATSVLLAGCVIPNDPKAASCDGGDPETGDLVLAISGSDLAEEGYFWSEAEHEVSLYPVGGAEYPDTQRVEDGRTGIQDAAFDGECINLSGLAAGWYEVDTHVVPTGGQGYCSWYGADPSYIEVVEATVNHYAIKSQLACE